MRTWFYYNEMEVYSDNPEFMRIDRLYCFNLDDFTEDEDNSLIRILNALPGDYRLSEETEDEEPYPYWFGTDVDNPPYLYCSYESPWGLQVVGVLKEADWLVWDSAFLEQTQHLPHYEIETEDAAFQEENKHLPKRWVPKQDGE